MSSIGNISKEIVTKLLIYVILILFQKGPGPAYSLPPTIGYDKHDQRKQRSPQYTMAGRLRVRNVNITPGPGINTQGFTRYGRATSNAFSMAARTFIKGVLLQIKDSDFNF